MLRSEEYLQTEQEIAGQSLRVISYRIGDRYFCHVESIDSGVKIARGQGSDRAEAERVALGKVAGRLHR